MSSTTTMIGDRRRQALERAGSARRHPTSRRDVRPATPPPVHFYVIAVVVTVFVLLGLVMVLSSSSVHEFHNDRSPFGIFLKQALWATLGVTGLIVAMRVPLHVWRRLAGPLLVGSCAAMLLPLLPGIGRTVNGAHAWIGIGPLNLQPSEFLKLTVLLFCASLLTTRQGEMADLRRTLRPVAVVATVAAGLCLLQKDLGTAIVVGAIVMVVLFLAGTPLLPLLGVGAVGVAGATLFVVSSPRRLDRFTAFLDIAEHRDHLSYQTWQAMIAVAQGGVTGEGVGRGASNLGDFLPLAHSDFIFGVIGEELGMIGVVAVLGGFLVLAYAGMQVALAAPDRFGLLLAGGVVGWLAVQTLINVGGVVGAMPVTGLTLPFFSAGGSSLFVTLCAVGLLLNVARNVRP
jgi:cell division protein FtsW